MEVSSNSVEHYQLGRSKCVLGKKTLSMKDRHIGTEGERMPTLSLRSHHPVRLASNRHDENFHIKLESMSAPRHALNLLSEFAPFRCLYPDILFPKLTSFTRQVQALAVLLLNRCITLRSRTSCHQKSVALPP